MKPAARALEAPENGWVDIAIVAAGLCVVWLAMPAVAAADWDAQVSTRLAIGGGAQIPEQGAGPWPMF